MNGRNSLSTKIHHSYTGVLKLTEPNHEFELHLNDEFHENSAPFAGLLD